MEISVVQRSITSTPISVTLSAPLTCRCPVGDGMDYADVEIRYEPTAELIELASLHDYLAEFTEVAMFHEDITVKIRSDVLGAVGNVPLVVTTRWAPVEGVTATVTA